MISGIVTPGELLSPSLEDISCAGTGTYIRNSALYSSVTGKVCTSLQNGKHYYEVQSYHSTKDGDLLVGVGSVVLCRVSKVQLNQVMLDIFAVDDDKELRNIPKGVLRREDVRLNEVDSLIMGECFKPGDIVRAVVISLGDARQYYLSTAAAEYGVRWALHSETGNIMIPTSWKVNNTLCNYCCESYVIY